MKKTENGENDLIIGGNQEKNTEQIAQEKRKNEITQKAGSKEEKDTVDRKKVKKRNEKHNLKFTHENPENRQSVQRVINTVEVEETETECAKGECLRISTSCIPVREWKWSEPDHNVPSFARLYSKPLRINIFSSSVLAVLK